MIALIVIILYIIVSLPMIIYLVVDGKKKNNATNQSLEEIKGKIGSIVREMNLRGYEEAKSI
jgi:membrane-bound ClpP family serine protease